VTRLYVKDDDSNRAVYVGAVVGDPPQRIELANRSIDLSGQVRTRCYTTYRLSSQSDDTATYDEVRK
jgi:hypothetical protein